MRNLRIPLVATGFAALAPTLPAPEACAAGFFIREQSTSALGTAFAGVTAAAEDPSHMYFNPAALGFQEGVQAQAAASVILPRARLEEATASTAGGGPIAGRTEKGDIAEDAAVPAIYGSWQLSEAWHLGLGVNAPFGLSTQYPDDWVGRYHGIDSTLRTLNVNPAVAFRPIPGLAVGFGIQIQYAEAELSSAIDFGTLAGGTSNPLTDGKVRLDGNDWGWGVTFGIVGDITASTRLGFAWRSKVEHTLVGDADFTFDSAGLGAIISGLTGAFVDTGAKAELTTPESFSFGFVQKLTDTLDVRGEAAFMRWSRFQELRVEFDNPAQPDSVTDEFWKDSWFFALGTSWRPWPGLTLRAGVAYDQSPVRARYRTPRIPDNDRSWVALGVSWEPIAGVSLEAGYTHIFVEDSDVRLTATGTGNLARGNLAARYENGIDIVTLGARLRF
ncbi:Putative outer membrane protein [bacterium HR40]|nr:Putative outer membrane protein [bacterium HR40]